MIVSIKTTKDGAGKWWGVVETDETTLHFEEGFRTRKECLAVMLRFMRELRNALDESICIYKEG